jgi:hypothetical protein
MRVAYLTGQSKVAYSDSTQSGEVEGGRRIVVTVVLLHCEIAGWDDASGNGKGLKVMELSKEI